MSRASHLQQVPTLSVLQDSAVRSLPDDSPSDTRSNRSQASDPDSESHESQCSGSDTLGDHLESSPPSPLSVSCTFADSIDDDPTTTTTTTHTNTAHRSIGTDSELNSTISSTDAHSIHCSHYLDQAKSESHCFDSISLSTKSSGVPSSTITSDSSLDAVKVNNAPESHCSGAADDDHDDPLNDNEGPVDYEEEDDCEADNLDFGKSNDLTVRANDNDDAGSLPDADAIKLFVGQIPREWDESECEALLAPFGRIHSLRLLRDRLGQSRGCLFVTYFRRKCALAAQDALHNVRRLAGMAHPLQLKPANALSSNQRKLFVGMLGPAADETAVRSMFDSFGSIDECSVLRDTDGQSRGTCAAFFHCHTGFTQIICMFPIEWPAQFECQS